MTVFTGTGGCSRCHMIRGQGGVLGPDLSSIGAQLNLKQLHETLTQERPIPNGYRPVIVTTLEGESVSGVARNSDAFSLQLLDEKADCIFSIPKNFVPSSTRSTHSCPIISTRC